MTDASQPSELRIMDAIGNIILTKTLVQSYDITMLPVQDLAAGVYICTVSQNGKTVMNSKIVVTH